MKKPYNNLTTFLTTVHWCLSLSWRTSKFYTIIRIAADIITPLLIIVAAFVGKHLLDLLSGGGAGTITSDVGQIVPPMQGLTSLLSNLGITPTEPSPHQSLIFLFTALATIAIIRLISQKATQYSQSMQTEMLNNQIAQDMMHRALAADIEYFDNPEYYDRLQSATQDSMAVSYILWNVLSCISSSVAFIGAFAVLYTASPLYGLLMLAAAVPASIASARYTKLLYMLSLEQVNEHRQMYYCQFIATDRRFAQDMRLYGAGERLRSRYLRIWQALFNKRKGMTRTRSVLSGLLECMPELVVVFIGVDIAFGVLAGVNTVGDYALFTGLAGQLWGSISMFSSSSLQIYDNKLKIENIKRLDTFENKVLDNGLLVLDEVESIRFDNVCFAYPVAVSKLPTPGSASHPLPGKGANPGDVAVAPALDGVSFTLRKDEKVVLVGLNGSGKSTLIKLLLRMYEPDKGVIYINGVDIREYKLAELRKNFSVYFQEMGNYNFTLRENFGITRAYYEDNMDGIPHQVPLHPLGRDDVEDEQIISALKAAAAHDILDKAFAANGKGLDTNLTRQFDPQGIELSGGQHQKLALARALYRPHTALILDEPSSNLDPKAEHEIFKNLTELTNGKMTIFTSHRLSNVSLADRILVLERGRLIEDGTQEQLIKNKHRYAELFMYQKEKYEV